MPFPLAPGMHAMAHPYRRLLSAVYQSLPRATSFQSCRRCRHVQGDGRLEYNPLCSASVWLATIWCCSSTSMGIRASREAFDDDSCGTPVAHPGPTTCVTLSGARVAIALGTRGRTTPGLRP